MRKSVGCGMLFLTAVLLGACEDEPDIFYPDAIENSIAVTLTKPKPGSILLDSATVDLELSSSDHIQRVEYYLDGTLLCTRVETPWTFLWNVRPLMANSTHSLQAKVFSDLNTMGQSPSIQVTTKRSYHALHLDGSSDFVLFPASSRLGTVQNALTVEAWVRIESSLSGGAVVACGGDYSVAILPSGKVAVTMPNINRLPNGVFYGNSPLPAGSWHHIAVSYDGHSETIFIDGQMDASMLASGNVSSNKLPSDLTLGAQVRENNSQPSSLFTGSIGELKIWNVGRTRSEVQKDMFCLTPRTEPGLLAYWEMDSNVNDLCTGGNAGLLYGSPIYLTFVP
jgi:hypothetical protein